MIIDWKRIEDAPEFDHRPSRQFIKIEGCRFHSDVFWARTWFDVAFIRPEGAENSIQGYREEDIRRALRDGDMEDFDFKVTHWAPFTFKSLEGELARAKEKAA